MKVVDAPVSGGAMGAADGTLAIMVGGSDEAFAAARPALDAMGVAGRPRRADRCRHEVQAGPQHDALRRVHGGDRGAAARRGRRPRPGRARQGGPAHRRDHRRTRRDHAPRHDRADRPGRLLVRRLRARRRAGGEGPDASRSRWPTSSASTYPWPARPGRLATASDSRDWRTDDHGQVRRPAREAPHRAGEDGGGLRLRHDRRRRRLLRLSPPTTCSPTSGTVRGSPTATGGCC